MTDVLAALRTRFLVRCADDLERIDRLLHRDALGDEEMRALAHKLAGAGGTFGFPDVSAAAGACDDAFAAGGSPDRATVERLAAAIRAAIASESD